MGRVIAEELQILGSHGLVVAEYGALLAEIAEGRLDLDATVGRLLTVEELPAAMQAMDHPPTSAGMTVARLR